MSSQKYCQNCKQKPAFRNHQFCGKTCAMMFSQNQYAPKMCKNCHKNQAHPGFDFCGKNCGIQYSQLQNSSTFSSQKMCLTCGIKKVYPGSDYCTISCRDKKSTSSSSFSNGKLNLAFNKFLQLGKNFDIKYFVTDVTAGKFSFSSVIPFYDKIVFPECYIFCNFFEMKSGIRFNNVTYSNVEAAYQASKYIHNQYVFQQFNSLDGGSAYRLAKKHQGDNFSGFVYGFLQNKVKIMFQLLQIKFSFNSIYGCFLEATGNYDLVEVTTYDTEWGIGTYGNGKNYLGRLLMLVRANLQYNRSGLYDKKMEYISRFNDLSNELK